MYQRLAPVLFLLSLLQLGGCDRSGDPQTGSDEPPSSPPPVVEQTSPAVASAQPAAAIDSSEKEDVEEMEWDSLMPKEWNPETLMNQYNADELSDDDPRAGELMDKLKALWKEAPVVPDLDGRHVRLPGFVVPLEMDEEKIDQFLLVPYYGACIHVPPPPANQTVHVVTRQGKAFRGELFDTVWVTGTLRVESLSSDLAEAGYRLENATVVPYEEGTADSP